MADYRTVTVTAGISSDINAHANVSSNLTAQARASEDIVDASAIISNSEVRATASLSDMVAEATAELSTKIISSGDFPVYSGPYEVTPTMEKQVLETQQRTLLDDVTVKKIPIYETSNLSGGTTVYIAMGEG